MQAIPGLKLIMPEPPFDAKALLKGAIRDDNPVVFFEHKRLYTTKGEVGEADDVGRLGEARVVREGADLTLISAGRGVVACLGAAEELVGRGIEPEVVDLRSHQPLDVATIVS